MGRFKQIVTSWQDSYDTKRMPTDREFWRYVDQTGGRIGLTDEQLREVGDE